MFSLLDQEIGHYRQHNQECLRSYNLQEVMERGRLSTIDPRRTILHLNLVDFNPTHHYSGREVDLRGSIA
jgi:hypothetical protein